MIEIEQCSPAAASKCERQEITQHIRCAIRFLRALKIDLYRLTFMLQRVFIIIIIGRV